jgi:hypothetical protein
MNRQAFHLRYRNRRFNLEKQLMVSYLNGLNKVLSETGKRVLQDKSIDNVLSEKEIANILIKHVKGSTLNVWNMGMFYGLQDAEEAYGKELPLVELKKADEIMKHKVNRELLSDEITNITKLTYEEFQSLGLGDVSISLVKNALKMVAVISKDYRKTMINIFMKMIMIGGSSGEIVNALRNGIKELETQNKYISQRIVQTETTRIFNGGSLAGYKKSTVVKLKGWSTYLRGNPRTPLKGDKFDHLGANGEEVSIDEPFMWTGEPMMIPGDENGSPENVINCHCGVYPVIRR